MPEQKELLIVGTGALATLFAARLSAAGARVTMLGSWQAGLDALNKHGARLIDLDGREDAHPVRAVRECEITRYALVLVKSWQTERVARQLASCLAKDGVALTLQNGLGNGEILAERLGEARVAQGVTTIGVNLFEAGAARVGGEGAVSLGGHPRLGAIHALLTEAGFRVARVSDLRALIWQKLTVNAAINPLTALLNLPNGALLENPAARDLMGALAREVSEVATKKGIALGWDDPAAAVEKVARDTAKNFSSMLQDIRRGAPTEIDFICGAVTREGERAGVDVSTNRVCWQLVRAAARHGKI